MSILSLEPKLNFDALPESISYDRQSKRYRDNKTGGYISRADSIKLQQSFLDRVTREFIALAPKIISGEIGSYKDAANLLKKIHVSNAIIKADGIDKLSTSDLGTIGNILKKQYYAGRDEKTGKSFGLKHLFREIQQKPNYSESLLRSRLEMYALSGEISGNVIERNKNKLNGLSEARRELGATHRHCDDCIRYQSVGWVGIDDLPLPKTACACLTRCQCTIYYR